MQQYVAPGPLERMQCLIDAVGLPMHRLSRRCWSAHAHIVYEMLLVRPCISIGVLLVMPMHARPLGVIITPMSAYYQAVASCLYIELMLSLCFFL